MSTDSARGQRHRARADPDSFHHRAPSAAYFFSRAMKKKGFKLSEREVNRIYWNRKEVAARLEASMPGIPSTIK